MHTIECFLQYILNCMCHASLWRSLFPLLLALMDSQQWETTSNLHNSITLSTPYQIHHTDIYMHPYILLAPMQLLQKEGIACQTSTRVTHTLQYILLCTFVCWARSENLSTCIVSLLPVWHRGQFCRSHMPECPHCTPTPTPTPTHTHTHTHTVEEVKHCCTQTLELITNSGRPQASCKIQ